MWRGHGLTCLCTDLAVNTGGLSRSVAMVGSTEENTSLSRALSQLAEIEEKIEQIHQDEADNDFYVMSELVKDYVQLISAIKVSDFTSELAKYYVQLISVIKVSDVMSELVKDYIQLISAIKVSDVMSELVKDYVQLISANKVSDVTSELVKGYLTLAYFQCIVIVTPDNAQPYNYNNVATAALQEVFGERVKIYKAWKDSETQLNKKREEKNKLELARKLDKVPPVAQECTRVITILQPLAVLKNVFVVWVIRRQPVVSSFGINKFCACSWKGKLIVTKKSLSSSRKLSRKKF